MADAFDNSYMSLYDLYQKMRDFPEKIKKEIGVFGFEFTQDYDAQVWEIKHNLNANFVLCQCYDVSNKQIIYADMEAVDANTLKLTFGKPIRGLAKIMTLAADNRLSPTI